MSYLLGDSTDSGLEFNYLELAKDVIECAAVLVEAELELVTTIDKRRVREAEHAGVIKTIEEFGQRTTAVVAPTAKEQAGTPVGRCASVIALAVKDAIDRELTTAKTGLASSIEELNRADQRLRARNRDVLEKLLRAHDLPEVDKTYEIAWTASSVKASMRERTAFGVEAVLALDVPASSMFGPDLRVDRVVEGVELHAVEAGGWLKKGDKLVPHKLGRYHITRVAVGPDVSVRMHATFEANSLGFTITIRGGEPLLVERHGDGAKEFQIEDQDKAKLCQLASRLEKEIRGLDAHRGELLSVDVDGKPIAEHAHPRELAERLIKTIAPTITKIARHSRSPGELVLRRMLGGNRREEIFMATSDLARLFERLPEAGRAVFAPLELDGKAYVAPAEPPKPKPQAQVVETPEEPKSAPIFRPAPAPAETKPPVSKPLADALPPTSTPRPRPLTSPRITTDRSKVRTIPPPTIGGDEGAVPAESKKSSDDEVWDEPKG